MDCNIIAELFRCLTNGVYVIGVAAGERRNAFTAVWLTQVSFKPLLIALAVNPGHASCALLKDGGLFSVNVLKKGQLGLARHFGTQSGANQDKLAGINWFPCRSGAPVLNDALAYLDCGLQASYSAGDHELILGVVRNGDIFDPNALPLTYTETGNMDGSRDFYPHGF